MRVSPLSFGGLLTICLAAGCSRSASMPNPVPAYPSTAARPRIAGFMLQPLTKDLAFTRNVVPTGRRPKKGIYVSEFYASDILAYRGDNRRNHPPACYVTGASYVSGIAIDGERNLIDPDGGSRTVRVFRGPRMCGPQLGEVPDPYGQPSDATSFDAASGTIVIANIFDGPPSKNLPGSLSLCTLRAGCTKNLTNPNIYEIAGVAQKKNGDCWASALTSSGAAKLIYFKRCRGQGQLAAGYVNPSFGGLDIDRYGNLVAISTFSAELYVYRGCSPQCNLVGGPFALRPYAVFGHLSRDSLAFATANFQSSEIDVYAYQPTSVQYEYAFENGLDASYNVEGVAYDPRL